MGLRWKNTPGDDMPQQLLHRDKPSGRVTEEPASVVLYDARGNEITIRRRIGLDLDKTKSGENA